jgi:hypothetical protein
MSIDQPISIPYCETIRRKDIEEIIHEPRRNDAEDIAWHQHIFAIREPMMSVAGQTK